MFPTTTHYGILCDPTKKAGRRAKRAVTRSAFRSERAATREEVKREYLDTVVEVWHPSMPLMQIKPKTFRGLEAYKASEPEIDRFNTANMYDMDDFYEESVYCCNPFSRFEADRYLWDDYAYNQAVEDWSSLSYDIERVEKGRGEPCDLNDLRRRYQRVCGQITRMKKWAKREAKHARRRACREYVTQQLIKANRQYGNTIAPLMWGAILYKGQAPSNRPLKGGLDRAA